LVVQEYDLRGPVVAAELHLEALLEPLPRLSRSVMLAGLSLVDTDLALGGWTLAFRAAAVVDSLRRAGGDLLEEVTVFDVYEGCPGGPGKRSLALRLSFRAADRTLSEAEVNKLRDRMLKKTGAELGAELRT